MPCQVSWQSVAIKLQPSVHGLGAEAAVAAEAPVGTTSAAHASTPQKAPVAARITAAKMPSFGMRASPAQLHDCTLVQSWPATQNPRLMQPRQKIPIRVAAAPQSSQEANGFRAATIAVGRHR